MVVNDLDVLRIAICPAKAGSPLIVDANAVLADAIALELLQTIVWRDAEILECLCGVDDNQLPKHGTVQMGRVPA